MFPLARGNLEAQGEGLDASAGATPVHAHVHARLHTHTHVHALLTHTEYRLAFLSFFSSPAFPWERVGPTAPGGGYQRQQLSGNSTWTPRNQRSRAHSCAATNPFWVSASNESLHAFPQLKSGVKLAKRTRLFFFFGFFSRVFFWPCSCIILVHIVLRYLS